MNQEKWAAIANSSNPDKESFCGPFSLPWLASYTPLLMIPMTASQINHLHSKSCLRVYFWKNHTKTMLIHGPVSKMVYGKQRVWERGSMGHA